jgi:hypothetical protein
LFFSLYTEMFQLGLGRDAINNDQDVNAATESHGEDPQNGRGRQIFNSINRLDYFVFVVCVYTSCRLCLWSAQINTVPIHLNPNVRNFCMHC